MTTIKVGLTLVGVYEKSLSPNFPQRYIFVPLTGVTRVNMVKNVTHVMPVVIGMLVTGSGVIRVPLANHIRQSQM